jgi:hypothetical protein
MGLQGEVLDLQGEAGTVITISGARSSSFDLLADHKQVEVGYAEAESNRIVMTLRVASGYVRVEMDPEDAQDVASELLRYVEDSMETPS